MNRRGFMAMVGAAICLPAAAKTIIPEATMRMAKTIAVRNVMVSGRVAGWAVDAGVRRITDIHWTEVALIPREKVLDPYIKEHGRMRRV